MVQPDFSIKTGDTGPAIEATLTGANDEAVNIFDADVRFIMRSIRGTEAVLAAEAENLQVGEDTNVGKVRYEWAEGDTETPGLYFAEWEVTFQNDAVETFPNDGHLVVAVIEDLD